MPLRFQGGEQLQRGRGIGGIFRFLKSVFTPLAKTVGKQVIGAVKSSAGKKIINVLKDQAIDSSMNLAAQAIRGNDIANSLHTEFNDAKSNLATTIEDLRQKRKRSSSPQSGSGIKRKKSRKVKTKQLKRVKTLKKKKVRSRKRVSVKRKKTNRNKDFFH